MKNLKQKIIDVLFQPNWFKYEKKYRYKNGIKLDWSEAEKRLKGETADKIIKLLE